MPAREYYEPGTVVRLMELNGKVSTDKYEITPNEESPTATVRSDRYSRISLTNRTSGVKITANHHRIIPVEYEGYSLVLESNSRFTAVCNICNCPTEVFSKIEQLNCPNCQHITQVFWPMGVQLMNAHSASPNTAKKATTKHPRKTAPPPKANKQESVDMEALKKRGEVFVKVMSFNHDKIDTRAYVVLLPDGAHSRKLCFNTYNGTVNAKKPVPVADFLANKHNGKTRWYAVKDVDKARAEILKKDYKREH